VPGEGKVILRRTWPQRLVIVACVGLVAAALSASWFVSNLYVGVAEIGRIEFPGDLLVTETPPTEPVNFLVIGIDSAEGIDADDPIHIGRKIDPRGTHNADSISIVRLDPVSGKAWVLSIPRDLLVDIPGSDSWKINASSLIGGAPKLVETINQTFDLQINHYVQLDFLAFRDVVDQLDGVPVWFSNPAKDEAVGLDVPVAGCRVMSGADALSYVRSRHYKEFVDGQWVSVGLADDLGRIERQQAFVVLTIERAIARGARNPTTLASLISAGAESVVLDQGLTPAELVDLSATFADFDPDSLARFSLQTVPFYDDRPGRGDVQLLVAGANDEVLNVFRGVADGLALRDVRFAIAGNDPEQLSGDAELLLSLGFDLTGEQLTVSNLAQSVIAYPPGQRPQAEVLARYIIPVPALVEDPLSTEMTLFLGDNHEAVSYFYPQDVSDVEAAVAAFGAVTVPTPQTVATVASTSSLAPTDTIAATTTSAAPVSAAQTPTTAAPTTTAAIGRAPEGESCG